jgi:ABC-type phosphate/phosphonate transport system substrate-binding protein
MKKTIFAFTVLLVACTARGADDIQMLVMDPLALKNSCSCVPGYGQRDYDALAGYLGEALRIPVCPRFCVALNANTVSPIIIGKQTEIEHATKIAGLKLTRVAMLTDKEGATTTHGLFVVRAKDNIKTIADLKGKKIIFGLEGAVEKHAAALATLKEAGIPLPEKIETRETCNQCAADVAEQRADAAVISSFALPLIEGCGTVGKGELRTVGRTADVMFIAAYVSDQFPAASLPALEKALAHVAQDKRLRLTMETSKGFIPTKKK